MHIKLLSPIFEYMSDMHIEKKGKRAFIFTGSQVDDTSNDREDCITSEEGIHGNLKKISISADDQTKYDPLKFLKSREQKVRSVLQSERTKRKRMKFYLTLQVRFT